MRFRGLAVLALSSISQASYGQPAHDTVARVKSCFRYERAARQECFDTLWRELAPETVPTAPRGDGSWIVSQTMSPLDYSPQVAATMVSRLSTGNAPASLTIGCRGQRTEISIGTAGSWRAAIGDDIRVAYRMNGEDEILERWAVAEDGRSAHYRGDAVKFLDQLRDNGQLSIRVIDGHGPTPPTAFVLTGLEAVRRKVTQVCRAPSAKSSSAPEWR